LLWNGFVLCGSHEGFRVIVFQKIFGDPCQD